MEKIERLAKEARNSISSYCIEECKAFCCRKGYLFLSEKEMKLTCGDKEDELTKKGHLIINKDSKYLFELSNPDACPRLDKETFMCGIHSNRARNSACKKFPVFIEGKVIRISERCPAKRAGKFYKFSHLAIKEGFKFE